ncbi:MAG: GGDEF domain-containing protein [Coriobacteriales bacterium]|nr:GGDEF domain-containing protein [Coriobacteriales bacterium]
MRFTLGKKVVLLLVTVSVVLCGIALIVSYRSIDGMNSRHYMDRADEIAATIARVVDAEDARKVTDEVRRIYDATEEKVWSDQWGSPEFNAYAELFLSVADTPEYMRLMEQLRRLQEVNGVDCLYMTIVVPEDQAVVYLVDAAEEDACPIGCIDPLYEFNSEVAKHASVGFPAYITNTPEYGWLVTAGAPIYDNAGNTVCYAMADISMDVIKKQQSIVMWELSLVLVSLTVLLCIVAVFLARRAVTGPLNRLAKAAVRYCSPKHEQRSTFEGLDIHTGDEIEDLYDSMLIMERDIDSHIDRLAEARAELRITKLEASKMNILAHRDALTGIRNKLAYNREIQRLNEALLEERQTSFGIAIVDLNDLKTINDTYGHDCGDMSIRRVSSLICTVFEHSPVFRIGGDEFAIVLRGHDYQNIAELAREFREAVEPLKKDDTRDLDPWERVSAAIGYALYDAEQDTNADDVCRRADKDMYQHKAQMKGKDTIR